VLLAMLGYPIEGCLLGPAFERLLASDYFVRVIDGPARVVALVGARFDVVLHHGNQVGTVHELVVDSAFRRQDLGRALLEAVLAEGRRRGAVRVELGSAADRPDAHAFYAAMGFEEIGIKWARVLRTSSGAV
jgi:GNAT superfamily N-acetyltransferase